MRRLQRPGTIRTATLWPDENAGRMRSLEQKRWAKCCANVVEVIGRKIGLCIELRNHHFVVADLVLSGGLTKENANQSLLVRTQRRVARSRGLFGVREAASV